MSGKPSLDLEPAGGTATTISLDFANQFNVPPILARLLGLYAAEAYCNTLPLMEGLQACVDQTLLDYGFQIANIKEAAQGIPKEGPLLITANHPTGILDGAIVLCALLSQRKDVWIVANEVLGRLPVLGSHIISLNKSADGDGGGFSALREMQRAWRRGDCVVAFPAGTVAHWNWKTMKIEDAPWATGIQRFAATLNVPERKATLEIQSPAWFHLCAAFSRKARLALLIRVFLSKSRYQPSTPIVFHPSST